MASLLCTRASKRYVLSKTKKIAYFSKSKKKKKKKCFVDITTDLLVANYFMGNLK